MGGFFLTPDSVRFDTLEFAFGTEALLASPPARDRAMRFNLFAFFFMSPSLG